jgi:protease IV
MSEQVSSSTDNKNKADLPLVWEREVLERLAYSTLKEQQRARRWSIFFKLLFAAYVLIFLLLFYFPNGISTPQKTEPHTGLVDVRGVIGVNSFASAENIIKGLQAALKNEHIAGVILRINSPGGSPVQAGQVNDEIRRLRQTHPKIPIHAVITDIGASGGYYIAASAEQIFADKASVVGSIGALINGFGFVEAMERIGVERRLFTAGDYKNFLDPFSPVKEADVQHVQNILTNIHEQFINAVKEGRGDRLNSDPLLFSGLVWTGEQALALGLIDGLGSSNYVAREIIGAEKIIDYTPKPGFLERFTARLSTALGDTLSQLTSAGHFN